MPKRFNILLFVLLSFGTWQLGGQVTKCYQKNLQCPAIRREPVRTLCTFAIIPSSLEHLAGPAGEDNDKKIELCEEVTKTARNYNDLASVIDIIKEYEQVFKYVPSIHPVEAKYSPRISSPYGRRYHPIDSVYRFHSGIDIVADYATTIHATANGKVSFTGFNSGYGKTVMIEHDYGFVTVYAHLTEFYTNKGKNVRKGEIIGFLGNTGQTTGSHLHYEIRKNGRAIDPAPFLNIHTSNLARYE